MNVIIIFTMMVLTPGGDYSMKDGNLVRHITCERDYIYNMSLREITMVDS